MEKINIEIPTGLTPEQEIFEIAKHLGQKLLPSNQKLLGSSYKLEELQTEIVITRKPIEKVTVTYSCPVCQTIFDKSFSKICYTNFGGVIKQKRLCSDDCRDFFININPSRISIKKSNVSGYMFHSRI